MAEESSTEVTLLQRVLADPFEDPEGFHLAQWMKHLHNSYPFWSFQPDAYARSQSTELPSTYPLGRIIGSLVVDDGILAHSGGWLPELDAALDQRRLRLAHGEHQMLHEYRDETGLTVLYSNSPQFLTPPDLAGYEVVDDDGGSAYVSPYEDVGREIADAVEARDNGTTKAARAEGAEQLRSLLERLGVLRARGRPRRRPTPELLEKLIGEGERLIHLLTGALGIPPSPRAAESLTAAGAKGDVQLWAERLALPVFSRFELERLQRPARCNARMLAAFVIARRIGVPPTALLREVFGPSYAVRYERRLNPLL